MILNITTMKCEHVPVSINRSNCKAKLISEDDVIERLAEAIDKINLSVDERFK